MLVLLGVAQSAAAGSRYTVVNPPISPPDGNFSSPQGIFVDLNQNVWVAASRSNVADSFESSYIYQFDAAEAFVRS